MARMLRKAYYQLKQCVLRLNFAVHDLEKANKQSHENGEDYTTVSLSDHSFNNLGKITKPCYELVEKRWELQKVPVQINKIVDLTNADFSVDDQTNINTCLNEMSAFNAWIGYVTEDSKYVVDKAKKLMMLEHDSINGEYIIHTPNVYLEKYVFPKLSKCKVLNDLFKTKPN